MRSWKTRRTGFGLLLLLVVAGPASADSAAPARRKSQSSARDRSKVDVSPSEPSDCAADSICRELMVRDRAFSLANHHTQALDAYQGAYALYPSALLLINIGRLQYKLGRPHEAVTALRSALAQTPETDVDKRARVQRFLNEAELAATSTPPPGTTIVTVSVPSPPVKEAVPIHKRWQLWTTVGGVLAVGAAALAIGLTVRKPFDDGPFDVYTTHPALTVRTP